MAAPQNQSLHVLWSLGRWSGQGQGRGRRDRIGFNQELLTIMEGEFQTRLNLLPIYRRQNNPDAIAATRQRLGVLIDQLPASREMAYGAIALGRSYQPVGTAFRCVVPGNENQAQAWLERGDAIAAQISDRRAQSFALGDLA